MVVPPAPASWKPRIPLYYKTCSQYSQVHLELAIGWSGSPAILVQPGGLYEKLARLLDTAAPIQESDRERLPTAPLCAHQAIEAGQLPPADTVPPDRA